MKKKSRKDVLSPEIVDSLRGKSIQVVQKNDKKKYSKDQYLEIYKGYDFLENLLVVRTFISKRYNIDFRTLEVLLKLMGMKVFTRDDYMRLPKYFAISRFSNLIETGYVNVLCDDHSNDNRVYTLNTKGRNIVVNFYKYLSGEKKIPEDSASNPMANSNKQVAFDKKKLELIKRINQLPVPLHFKKLFQD